MMTEQRIRDLLPIGSVVMLKDAKKALMIYGVCQTEKDTKAIYDYMGVLWPEGNIGADTQFLFNQTDVDHILFRGFDDSKERVEFIEMLIQHYKNKG